MIHPPNPDTKNCDCDCPPPPCDCIKPVDGWWKSLKPCNLVYDLATPPYLFSGKFYAQVRECDSQTTATVIDVDDAWLVDIHIEVGGLIPKLWCGHWCISVCLESMCGGKAYRFPRDLKDDPPGYCCQLDCLKQRKTDYDEMICIPKGIVKPDECGSPYELTVIITVLGDCQYKPGHKCDPLTYYPIGIAGACEVAHLMFYEIGQPYDPT